MCTSMYICVIVFLIIKSKNQKMKTRILFVTILFTIIFSCSKEEANPVITPAPQLSSENNISKLVLEQNEIEYSTSISGITIDVNDKLPYNSETIQIKSIELSEKATANVKATDSFNILSGSFQIQVIAENGNEKIYTVNVLFEERMFDVTVFEPSSVSKTYTVPTYAHYMPWFGSKDISGNWHHWGEEADMILTDGKRKIPTVYYPLIDLYDSNDEDYLEYSFLCMKLAGLDGVFIDYYTNTELFDFPFNLERTLSAIDMCEKIGLNYAVVYEDWTLNSAEENGLGNQIDLFRNNIDYLESNIFNRPNYVHYQDKPLFMIFGPQSKLTGEEWRSVIKDNLSFAGVIWMVDETISSYFDGVMSWTGDSDGAANELSNCQENYNLCIAGAMPGFETLREGWPVTDPRDGENFREGLQFAKDKNPTFLQIPTWNDWEEGTIIEPSLEFGYSRLETLQNFLGVSYTKEELELTVQLYKKRKEHKGKVYENQVLDQVFYYLISLQIEEAKNLINEI